MAERRPDLAREHRLHDRFRGPPRASPVRFQVSRPADRTSRGWARGVPLAECRFPGPATRRLGRLRRESERSTAPVAFVHRSAKTFGGVWWWWWWQQLRITSGRLPRIWGSIFSAARFTRYALQRCNTSCRHCTDGLRRVHPRAATGPSMGGIWLELRRLPQILFYVVARMVIFKSRNQLQKATRRKVTMLL